MLRNGTPIRAAVVATVLGTALAACTGGTGPGDEPGDDTGDDTGDDSVKAIAASWDFDGGSDGWASDIADYTDATRPDDFLSETGAGPPGLDEGTDFFHLAATNTSDDLFMYLRREVGPELPLEPDTTYEVDFIVEFASNAPSDCAGIGGAPGESVWLKVGATATEPVPVSQDGSTDLSVDKGGQSQGGPAADVTGDVANGIPCEQAQEQDLPYAMVTREHSLAEPVTSTQDGRLWLLVGTDSGFEGRTSLYYHRIAVTLTPTG